MRAIWVGKRQASRAAVVIRAELRTGDDKPIGQCSIVDISRSGARARMEGEFPVPPMFALFIPARNETRVCKLRWHRDSEIGIEFIAAEQITTFQAVITLELRVKALEEALRAGGVAVPEPEVLMDLETVDADVPESGPAATGRLEERISQVETEISHAVQLVQAQIGDTLAQNLAARLAKLESQSKEVHDMLKTLLPLLMSRAS